MIEARTGVELELLGPVSFERQDLARAIADRVGGDVRHGFKHRVDGELAPGRPRCVLTHALRVVDTAGAWVCDVVDDPTIDSRTPHNATQPILLLDDTRFALWVARTSWSSSASLSSSASSRLAQLCATFSATIVDDRVVDPHGQVLAVIGAEPAHRARVCEVVTAPLPDGARDALLRVVLDVAVDTGCTIADTAALHVHVDAAPWQQSRRLARLIVAWNAQREAHLDALRTNRRCLKLGAFPVDVVRVAEAVLASADDVPFSTMATGLVLAGAKKELDLNLRGCLDAHPMQPTLEVRCLPMSLETDSVLHSLRTATSLLVQLADG